MVAGTFCVLVIALIFYVYILLINLILNIMATTQTIDATIFASTHPDIAKRTSVSGVLISSVMLLIGILAFASIFELDDKSSTASMALMVLGTGLFLMGIFRLFWKSKEVIYLPTKSVAKEHSVFLI